MEISMAGKERVKTVDLPSIGKSATGIRGLDEITQGGLPQGRPTLLCGSAGCGKTLFGMTFLYKGAVEYDEPGVFLAFEEHPEDLIKNVGSLNYDIEKRSPRKSSPSTTLRSSAARSPRRANTISKVFSSASALPSIQSALSASLLTRSRRCLPAWKTSRCFAPNCAGCSSG